MIFAKPYYAIILSACLLMIISCRPDRSGEADLAAYVNPFIGTNRMGHTYPGATTPFGMVQLSPETNVLPMYIDGSYNPDAYKYCSGYQYEDTLIYGFSHTHFSGTGHSDLGDFLLMPMSGNISLDTVGQLSAGSMYRSKFSHNSENASPGYYKVLLEDSGITAELTATDRVGFHKYTFTRPGESHILLDMIYNIYHHDDKNVWTFIRVENDSLVTGYRQTNGWARTRTVYFAMQFSKPFKSYGHKKYDKIIYRGFYRKFNEKENFPEMAGKNIRAHFDFETVAGENIMIKFSLSPVSTEGALNNLYGEITGWDFEKVRQQSREKWNRELSKIVVETMTREDKEVFYTALYHTMLSPVIYEDVDGKYRGLDQNIHTSDGFTNYTTFSLWDTFRALHPLNNIIQQRRNTDMIRSMLAHYDQSVHHMLPIWSHYANENWCMIGYHAVSVIADAIVKGNAAFDWQHALEASTNTSNCHYFDGIGSYINNGYVAEDHSINSVSKTLEYAYDDWCIAQIANASGDNTSFNTYMNRSGNFRNNFDRSSGFMRPKMSDGTWKPEFDPLDTHGQGFIEGNAWTYSLFVPHDPEQLITLMGGDEKFTRHLDSLFTMTLEDKYIEKNEDITRDGIIGNYVHGNEPGHHIPYLYNWTKSPWKTQARVRMIMNTMYGTGPDGLCGNDDAGQLSAWYIFSALGFYPVCPGSDRYAIGSPLITKATINLENGKKLLINTVNQAPGHVDVQRVLVNGTDIGRNYLLHKEIINGGEITFYMSDKVFR